MLNFNTAPRLYHNKIFVYLRLQFLTIIYFNTILMINENLLEINNSNIQYKLES
jgi:hypothetical protein